MVILWILLGATALCLLASYGCYRMAFYAPPRKPPGEAIEIPQGKAYEPYREKMTDWARKMRALPAFSRRSI